MTPRMLLHFLALPQLAHSSPQPVLGYQELSSETTQQRTGQQRPQRRPQPQPPTRHKARCNSSTRTTSTRHSRPRLLTQTRRSNASTTELDPPRLQRHTSTCIGLGRTYGGSLQTTSETTPEHTDDRRPRRSAAHDGTPAHAANANAHQTTARNEPALRRNLPLRHVSFER